MLIVYAKRADAYFALLRELPRQFRRGVGASAGRGRRTGVSGGDYYVWKIWRVFD